MGQLVTEPVDARQPRLFVNARLNQTGTIRVGLRSAEAAPIAGRSLEDCDPIRGDAIDHAVRWRGETSLGRVQGERVRLHIEVTYGTLFAFRFGTAPRDLS